MRESARDVLGAIRCERALQQLRDTWLTAIAGGQSPLSSEAAAAAEQQAMDQAWASLEQLAEKLLVGDGARQPATPGGRLTIAGIVAAHRCLANLPTVGDPAFVDPTPVDDLPADTTAEAAAQP